jgi:hypothetical protein
MPGGWPREEIEKETCARALLASGGDLERVYDESDLGLDAYIHHIARVPFFRSAQEDAIVLATGTIQSVVDLLQFYTRLYELVDTFDRATWIAYLARNRLGEFLRQAQTWGDVEYLGGEMYCWYTSPSPILIISNQSHASGLRRAVNDLEQAPESGVVAVGNDASGVASASAQGAGGDGEQPELGLHRAAAPRVQGARRGPPRLGSRATRADAAGQPANPSQYGVTGILPACEAVLAMPTGEVDGPGVRFSFATRPPVATFSSCGVPGPGPERGDLQT